MVGYEVAVEDDVVNVLGEVPAGAVRKSVVSFLKSKWLRL